MFVRIASVFLPGKSADENLERALDAYAKGNDYATYVHAARLRDGKAPSLQDEAALLLGLSAAAIDARDLAAPALRQVLDAPEVSPYYAVALGALLELETRSGNRRLASQTAERYLADLWRKPTSPREAAVKALFLETGNLSPVPQPRMLAVPDKDDRLQRQQDRPADRAVYLAATALLAEKEFAKGALCFDAITPQSIYFPYARYGLGQASYGLHQTDDAAAALGQVLSYPAHGGGDVFLKDRAALALAQVLHDDGRDSAAIRALDAVSRSGPFALHAALLAAQIQADAGEPALALVYLKDRPADAGEPKLAARAVALDADLRRRAGDAGAAIAELERGIRVLDDYSARVREVAGGERALAKLLVPLKRQQRRRDRVEAWRRSNLKNAVPDLLDATPEPGWLSRVVARWMTRGGEDGYPVIYYPKSYDPFSQLRRPREMALEPPADTVFPSLFRRSLGPALVDAFRRESALRAALAGEDDLELSLRLLDSALRSSAAVAGGETPLEAERARALGFGDAVVEAAAAHRPRVEVMAAALESARPLAADAERHARLVEIGRGELARLRAHERELLKEAVAAEARAVEEMRYSLEFELSQALAVQKDAEKTLLQSGALPGSPPS